MSKQKYFPVSIPPGIKVGSVRRVKPLVSKGRKKIEVTGISDSYGKHFPRKFDFVVPFEESHFGWMRGYEIPEKYRIRRSVKKLKILMYEKKYREIATQQMRKLTEICNVHSYKDHESRFRYQRCAMTLLKILAKEFLSEYRGEDIRIIQPLRAGAFAGIPYDLDEDRKCEAIFKRLPMKNGKTWLGISNVNFSGINKNSIVAVTEGCTGSGATVVGLMIYLKQKDQIPKVLEVHSINSPMHSAIFIFSAAEELGFNVRMKTASIGFYEDNKLYNLRTGDEWNEGVYYVCDAGDFSLPLPRRYDRRAWWNKGRILKGGYLVNNGGKILLL